MELTVLRETILLFLSYEECPECGCPRAIHDGDCSRDWQVPGKGLFGDKPRFKGTELVGLLHVVRAILARKDLMMAESDPYDETPRGVD